MLDPEYIGHTWFLSQTASLSEAVRLRQVLKISNTDVKQACRLDLHTPADDCFAVGKLLNGQEYMVAKLNVCTATAEHQTVIIQGSCVSV